MCAAQVTFFSCSSLDAGCSVLVWVLVTTGEPKEAESSSKLASERLRATLLVGLFTSASDSGSLESRAGSVMVWSYNILFFLITVVSVLSSKVSSAADSSAFSSVMLEGFSSASSDSGARAKKS